MQAPWGYEQGIEFFQNGEGNLKSEEFKKLFLGLADNDVQNNNGATGETGKTFEDIRGKFHDRFFQILSK